jgi:hypothetical protein
MDDQPKTRKERKPPKEKRQHTSKHVRAVTERAAKPAKPPKSDNKNKK